VAAGIERSGRPTNRVIRASDELLTPDGPIPEPAHSLAYNLGMANLTLVYGLRLLPSDEITEVGSAPIKLKNGREAHVTMHTLEGSKDEIEKQLKTSLAAFFDIYPEI
jgi:hypothetical protein